MVWLITFFYTVHHTKWLSKILLYKVHVAVNRVHGVKKWTSSFIINWSKVVCGFCHTLRLLRIFFSKASFFHYILYELSWKFIDGSQKSSCHVITYFRSQWTICYAVKSFLWLKFGDKKQVNQYFWNISKWQNGPASSPASLSHSEKISASRVGMKMCPMNPTPVYDQFKGSVEF